MESAEDALYGLEHARRLERLHHEILRARLDRLDHEGLLTHRAAHQDLRVGVVLHDLPHGVDAAHVRHHDVHRDQVGLELLVPLDRLRAGLGFSHDLEAGLRQDVADHRPHEDGVVADEDSVAHTPSLGRQNGVEQRVGIEDHEELPGAAPDGPHQRRINAGQRLPAFQRLPAHREEVHHFVHGEARSEEHTSELQSLAYLVCRLLLEKKKKYHTSDDI